MKLIGSVIHRFIAGAVVGLLLVGCSSNKLDSLRAQQIVQTDISDKDAAVIVGGVSQSDSASAEAVVQASAFGLDLHLGFRRYDTGWKWETTELPDRSKITAKQSVEQLRDMARLNRAKTWAGSLIEKYRTTAETIYWLHGNMNRKVDEAADQPAWDMRHQLTLSTFRNQAATDPKRKALLDRLDPPTDAWGHHIKWVLNPGDRSAFVVSLGPDGVIDTKDDLVCQFVGHKNWDSLYSKFMWDYTLKWRLPEGLADAIGDFLPPKTKDSDVIYVRFIE